MITWTASNNSSFFLAKHREAISILAAVRAGRAYVRGELCCEGKVTIYNQNEPVRTDTKNMFTNYKWSVNTNMGN